MKGSCCVSRVTAIADKLGLDFALIHKKRGVRGAEAPEQMELLVGDVRDKVRGRTFVPLIRPPILLNIQVAILVDDMIDSGRTLSLAVRTLHENGAKAIYALISHGLLSEVKMSMLESLPFERLVVRTPRWDYLFVRRLTTFQVTNSISQSRHDCSKLVQIDTSPTIAESIRRTHNGESISLLFGDWPQTMGQMNGLYNGY